MALFIGTWEEFKEYLNDYVKNKVPALTRKYKTGKCQLCQCNKATDAAHRHEHDRLTLIRESFDTACIQKNHNQHIIDMKAFATHSKSLHSNPDMYYFLCSKCHRLFDAPDSLLTEKDFAKRI